VGDLDYLTQDVTVKDDVSGNKQFVNADNEALVHDQHVIQAIQDNAAFNPSPHYYQELGNYYSAVAGGTLANKNEAEIMWWDNPAASGMDIEFWDFDMGTPNNITFIWRLYINPTVTVNGTAYTPVQLNTSSANTSDALVYTLPTTTDYGTLADIAVVTIGTLRNPLDFGIAISDGDSALVTMQASSANNDYFLSIKWAEDSD